MTGILPCLVSAPNAIGSFFGSEKDDLLSRTAVLCVGRDPYKANVFDLEEFRSKASPGISLITGMLPNRLKVPSAIVWERLREGIAVVDNCPISIVARLRARTLTGVRAGFNLASSSPVSSRLMTTLPWERFTETEKELLLFGVIGG